MNDTDVIITYKFIIENKGDTVGYVDKLIDKLIEINPEMAENELKKMIINRYIVFKKKKKISLEPIEDAFEDSIKAYLTRVEKLRLK